MHRNINICKLSREDVYHLLYDERVNKNAYAAYIRGKRCSDYDSFFNEVSATLQFPDYFGSNWPALDECLTDLEWISPSRLVIFFDDYSNILSNEETVDRDILCKHLAFIASYWADEQGIPIYIYLNN